MKGIPIVLRALHQGERDLELELLATAERHRDDHEVHHVARDLARWSHEHAARLAAAVAAADGPDPGPTGPPSPAFPGAPRDQAFAAPGSTPDPGLLLLQDLNGLHLAASANSLRWEMLARAAQAARESRLVELAADCHPQTLRQIRWANTMIRTLSPQILTGLR